MALKTWLDERLPTKAITGYRTIRGWWFLAMEPLDYLGRVINGKHEIVPPLYLRRIIGPLRSWETSGAEFQAYLKLLCGLKPSDALLDIGCGCGMMALQLGDYLAEGKYVGTDVHGKCVEWCQQKVSRAHSNCSFIHLDVYNGEYNTGGRYRDSEYRFPLDDASFDVVLLKSVFTHLLPEGTGNYLKEIARVLNPGGRCLASFFVLNQEQRGLESRGKNSLSFRFGDEATRYVQRNNPEAAFAYEETTLLNLIEESGLEVANVCYGSWSGRPDGLSYQDLLVLRRKP